MVISVALIGLEEVIIVLVVFETVTDFLLLLMITA
jgi:hypothetical protein